MRTSVENRKIIDKKLPLNLGFLKTGKLNSNYRPATSPCMGSDENRGEDLPVVKWWEGKLQCSSKTDDNAICGAEGADSCTKLGGGK